MSKQVPILYVVEANVVAEDMEYFERWYASRHAPDLYNAGFHRCTSYKTTKGPFSIMDVYEIPNREILESAPYLSVAQKDPYRTDVLKMLGAHGASLYNQVHIFPAPESGSATLDGQYISIAWFDLEDETSLADIFDNAWKRLQREGCSRVRLGRRTADHPLVKSRRPQYILFVEWEKPGISSSTFADFTQQAMTSKASNIETYAADRVYPWPNSGFYPATPK